MSGRNSGGNENFDITNAADDPVSMDRISTFIELWRRAAAPLLNSEPGALPHNQSLMITAAAIHAGATVGHMLAVGVLRESDRKRIERTVIRNFRKGINYGLAEAGDAIRTSGATQ